MKFQGSILLVDDEAHIRKYVALILKQLGATKIVEATNGEEAIRVLQILTAGTVTHDGAFG